MGFGDEEFLHTEKNNTDIYVDYGATEDILKNTQV